MLRLLLVEPSSQTVLLGRAHTASAPFSNSSCLNYSVTERTLLTQAIIFLK